MTYIFGKAAIKPIKPVINAITTERTSFQPKGSPDLLLVTCFWMKTDPIKSEYVQKKKIENFIKPTIKENVATDFLATL